MSLPGLLLLLTILGFSATSSHAAALQLAQSSGYSVMAVGDIRAVDREAGTVTIDHGPLLNLSLPGAVRVFAVADRNVLESMKAGDPVRFIADTVAGRLTIIRVQTEPDDPHGDH